MDVVLVGFAVLLVLVFLRLPIAFAMGIVGFTGFGYLSGWQPSLSMVGTLVSETALSYGLSVVPLFILMGNLVSRAGFPANCTPRPTPFSVTAAAGSPWRPS